MGFQIISLKVLPNFVKGFSKTGPYLLSYCSNELDHAKLNQGMSKYCQNLLNYLSDSVVVVCFQFFSLELSRYLNAIKLTVL